MPKDKDEFSEFAEKVGEMLGEVLGKLTDAKSGEIVSERIERGVADVGEILSQLARNKPGQGISALLVVEQLRQKAEAALNDVRSAAGERKEKSGPESVWEKATAANEAEPARPSGPRVVFGGVEAPEQNARGEYCEEGCCEPGECGPCCEGESETATPKLLLSFTRRDQAKITLEAAEAILADAEATLAAAPANTRFETLSRKLNLDTNQLELTVRVELDATLSQMFGGMEGLVGMMAGFGHGVVAGVGAVDMSATIAQ